MAAKVETSAPVLDPRYHKKTWNGTPVHPDWLRAAWMREYSGKKNRWERQQLEGTIAAESQAAQLNLYLLAGVGGVAIVAVLILR